MPDQGRSRSAVLPLATPAVLPWSQMGLALLFAFDPTALEWSKSPPDHTAMVELIFDLWNVRRSRLLRDASSSPSLSMRDIGPQRCGLFLRANMASASFAHACCARVSSMQFAFAAAEPKGLSHNQIQVSGVAGLVDRFRPALLPSVFCSICQRCKPRGSLPAPTIIA